MLQKAASTVETDDSGCHLGGEAELDPEPLCQVAATPTDLSGHRIDLRRTPTGDELTPRPDQLRGQRRSISQTASEYVVEDVETLGPGASTAQALSQVSSSTAHDVIETNDQRCEITWTDAEHGVGTERRQLNVEATQAGAVGDDGGRRMQSTYEGAERIGRLASIRHRHDIDRRVEADDKREGRRRQTKVRSRIHALQARTHVPVDEQAQAPGWAPNRTLDH